MTRRSFQPRLSQPKSPRKNARRISQPVLSSDESSEDDLDVLFSNDDSKIFSDVKSYKTNHSTATTHHQITAAPSETTDKTYTVKRNSKRKRPRSSSQKGGTPGRKKRKSYNVDDSDSDVEPTPRIKKSKKNVKRLSVESTEAIDFWKNLSSEPLLVKKASAISPTKVTLCRQRDNLDLSGSDKSSDEEIIPDIIPDINTKTKDDDNDGILEESPSSSPGKSTISLPESYSAGIVSSADVTDSATTTEQPISSEIECPSLADKPSSPLFDESDDEEYY